VHGLTPAFWQVTFVEGQQVRVWRKYDEIGQWQDERGWLLKPDDPLIEELEAAVTEHLPSWLQALRPDRGAPLAAQAPRAEAQTEHNGHDFSASVGLMNHWICDRCGIGWSECYTRGCAPEKPRNIVSEYWNGHDFNSFGQPGACNVCGVAWAERCEQGCTAPYATKAWTGRSARGCTS
jgi:hypothetical protein